MTGIRPSTHHRTVKHGWMFAVTLLALGGCDVQLQDTSSSGNQGNSSGGGDDDALTATVVANTEMTATIIDNFSGTNAHGAKSSLPKGTNLTNTSLTVANSLGDTATGSFSLDTTGGLVVFRIQDDAACRGLAMIAGVGKNQTPNNHQTLITLFTSEPTSGLLTVILDGQASSLAGSGFTTIDVGNDGSPDFQTPNLQGIYQEILNFDSTFEIRTETVTQVENINTISRSITLTFAPSGTSDSGDGEVGTEPAGPGKPLVSPMGLGAGGHRPAGRTVTTWGSTPSPRDSGEAGDRESLRVRTHQVDSRPWQSWPDECQVGEDPGQDCDGDRIRDWCQLLRSPSLDCDGDSVLDACQLKSDPLLDQNQNGTLDRCECAFESYCSASGHSGGQPAAMGASGSASISSNDLTLTVRGAPALEFGMFFYGGDEDFTFAGEGAICVRPPLHRIDPVILTDGSGMGRLGLDLSSPPFSSGGGQIAPFETWHFQFWFRDPPGGQAGYNFSDGLAVTFCP